MSLFAANDFSPSATAAYTNFALMRFFRDLARAKARRRRFEQRHALMSLMMGSEEPLPLGDAAQVQAAAAGAVRGEAGARL